MKTKDYLKYYWLEQEYLEKEVYSEFHKNHYLTPEQFFAIIIWKRNASKTHIKERILNGQPVSMLPKIIEKITRSIYNAPTKEKKLQVILDFGIGIRLSIASAILTILYPDDFSVYDYRVRGEDKDISSFQTEKSIRVYFGEYISKVKKSEPHLSLRDCDRTLWAKSWYEDLQKFISK